MFKPRTYRRWMKSEGLVTFEVSERETDLSIAASKNLKKEAKAALLFCRNEIESYIRKDSRFYTSLEPIAVPRNAPLIVKAMAEASKKAGVGPMASVAGAVAEFVGRELLKHSDEVIVENGGDIFLRSLKERVIGVYAGDDSHFTNKIAVKVGPAKDGVGVCTSSGTVSHSLSFGNADAALIIAGDTALADAAATATGNMVKQVEDIEKGIAFAKSIEGVLGVLVIVKDRMGSWGKIKLG